MSKITSSEKRQLSTLKNNNEFNDGLKKILNNQQLNFDEAQFMLTSSLIFFRYYNNDKRFKGYFNIAYYIILKYCLIHNDYKPLYDISLQIGFYPISEFILKNNYLEENYFHESLINQEIRIKYSNDKYVETVEQFNRSEEIFKNVHKRDLAYIAPTSFGKSAIIQEVIKQNNFSKIAIIVPTKSLIIQTYNDIRNLNLNYKLILHDEMYNGEDRFIGILTQERATRLINKVGVALDILFIDEAHNILKNNSRNYLLARLIMLNYKKNENQRLLYLSPLISDTKNLKIRNTSEGQIFENTIRHNLKSFDVNYLDKKGKLSIYNRFTDDFYQLAKNINFYEYILENSQAKSFIYNYRPKYVAIIANQLAKEITLENNNENLKKISEVISKEISEDIDLVNLLVKGIIYLHGKLPNILKEYLEYQYKDLKDIKFVIANSVILEGINFPIDTLFISSTYGLNVKDLNNLIGRVNRLNYVFKDSLSRLISLIHFVDSVEYTDKRSDMVNKIKLLRDHTFKDENKNPLLQNYNVEELKLTRKEVEIRKGKDEKIIQSTEFLINADLNDLYDKIKHGLLENYIDDFYKDINIVIPKIIENLEGISDKDDVISTIYEIFILNLETEITDFEIERLKNEKARSYYKNYINIFQLLGLKEKISNTLKYFRVKSQDKFDSYLFIGNSFGELRRPSEKYNNFTYQQDVYINLNGKTKQELANIALIKIKLEEDFVSFKLKKLTTFLFDFKLITKNAYYLAIYGSIDEDLINLTRIGLSPNITRVLKESNQIKNITFDENGNLISNLYFKKFMQNQTELFKFEVTKYIK